MYHLRPQPGRPVLVLVHGLLSDHVTWQLVAGQLADDYDVWLVDLPGCGQSEAPKPSSLEPDGYSPTALAARIWQALQQCLEEHTARPAPITLVGHSLGGTVVLRMNSAPDLRDRYSRMVARVNRLVLIAPCDLAVNAVPPRFTTLLGLKSWQVTLGESLGLVEPEIRALTRASYHDPECATVERQQEYRCALVNKGRLAAAQAMLLQFAPFDPKTRRPRWPEIDRIIADYQNVSCPVLVVYGTWDETLPPAMGNKLKDEIPGAVLAKIPARGHSLPTEDPQLCATLIRHFQQTGSTEGLAANFGVNIYTGPSSSMPSRLVSLPAQ